MSNNNTYFASKPRYEILDGLRGVAAGISGWDYDDEDEDY